MLSPISQRNTTKAFPWFWAIMMVFFLSHSPCYAAPESKTVEPKAPAQKAATQNAPAAQPVDPSSFVNVYTTEESPLWEDVFKTFGEKTGIRIRYSVQSGADIIKKLTEDGDIPKADAVIIHGLPFLWQAGENGLLQNVPSLVLESSVPSALQGGAWFAFAQQAHVIVYDKTKHTTPPSGVSSYEALASPIYQSMICLSGASVHQSWVASMVQAHGEKKTVDWIKGLLGNAARPPVGGDGDQIKDLLAGQCALAVVGDDTVRRLPPEDQAKLGIIYPNSADRGTHITITGAGVVKNAARRAEAIKLMEFLVSRPVQDRLANEAKQYRAVNVIQTPNQKNPNPFGFRAEALVQTTLGPYTDQALILMDKASW